MEGTLSYNKEILDSEDRFDVENERMVIEELRILEERMKRLLQRGKTQPKKLNSDNIELNDSEKAPAVYTDDVGETFVQDSFRIRLINFWKEYLVINQEILDLEDEIDDEIGRMIREKLRNLKERMSRWMQIRKAKPRGQNSELIEVDDSEKAPALYMDDMGEVFVKDPEKAG